MTKKILDGALLIGLLICLSVTLVTVADADEFRPELSFGANAVALEGTLEDVRGKGSDGPIMDKLLSATLGNNTSVNNGSIAASNSILDNSFANSSGFLTVIQNAADNVVIQATTSLTVNFNP